MTYGKKKKNTVAGGPFRRAGNSLHSFLQQSLGFWAKGTTFQLSIPWPAYAHETDRSFLVSRMPRYHFLFLLLLMQSFVIIEPLFSFSFSFFSMSTIMDFRSCNRKCQCPYNIVIGKQQEGWALEHLRVNYMVPPIYYAFQYWLFIM